VFWECRHSRKLLKRMAGTTGLEPATSAVTVAKATSGLSGISRLRVGWAGLVGIVGSRWDGLFNVLFNAVRMIPD